MSKNQLTSKQIESLDRKEIIAYLEQYAISFRVKDSTEPLRKKLLKYIENLSSVDKKSTKESTSKSKPAAVEPKSTAKAVKSTKDSKEAKNTKGSKVEKPVTKTTTVKKEVKPKSNTKDTSKDAAKDAAKDLDIKLKIIGNNVIYTKDNVTKTRKIEDKTIRDNVKDLFRLYLESKDLDHIKDLDRLFDLFDNSSKKEHVYVDPNQIKEAEDLSNLKLDQLINQVSDPIIKEELRKGLLNETKVEKEKPPVETKNTTYQKRSGEY